MHHGTDTCSNRECHLAECICTIELKCFTSVDGADVPLFSKSPLNLSARLLNSAVTHAHACDGLMLVLESVLVMRWVKKSQSVPRT